MLRTLSAPFVFTPVLLLTSALHAQDMNLTGPRVPEPSPPATIPLPTPAPSGQATELVLPSLKGLILVDSQERVSTPPDASLAVTNAVPFLQDRPALLGDLLKRVGQPLTTADLEQIVNRIITECRAMGRPVVDVFVPEQDVTEGFVRIVVIEGILGAVRVEGGKHTDSAWLIAQVQQKPGEPIRTQPLLEDLDWMNQNPFRDVQLAFQKGTLPRTTDIVLRVNDSAPFRIYGGYENTGTIATGKDRLLAGFNLGRLLGATDQLNYQFTSSPTISQFQAHGASYIAPLPWRDILTISGTWSTSRPVNSDPLLTSQGTSWEVSGNYQIPLSPTQSLRHNLQFGANFKRSDNNLEFGGTQIFGDYTDIVQFSAAYNAQLTDPLGRTSANAILVLSPGDLGANNDNDKFRAVRADASAKYVYFRAAIDRQTILPKELQLVTRLTGQFSDSPLLASEQLSAGGADTVRGYPAQIVNGDSGLIFINELRTPALQILNLDSGQSFKDALVFLAFLDAGFVNNRGSNAGTVSNATLIGAGPGVRYNIGPYLTMQYSYGFAVSNHNVTTGNGESHISIIASFTW